MTYEEAEKQCAELFDEVYPEIKFGYLTYSASRVLQEVDPTAWRQEVLDYQDHYGNGDDDE